MTSRWQQQHLRPIRVLQGVQHVPCDNGGENQWVPKLLLPSMAFSIGAGMGRICSPLVSGRETTSYGRALNEGRGPRPRYASGQFAAGDWWPRLAPVIVLPAQSEVAQAAAGS